MKIKIYLILFSVLLWNVACRKSDPEPEKIVLGQLLVDLNANENHIRKREALIGNFIADALFSYYTGEGIDIDFVLINSGSIRFDPVDRPAGIYPKGELSNLDLDEMLPFGNNSVIVKITGAELKQVFERSIAQYPEGKGPFMQVSKGFKVTYDTLQSPQLININQDQIVTPGFRVASIYLNEVQIDPNSSYTIITSDFIAEGNDGYVAFKNIPAERKVFLSENYEVNALKDYVIVQQLIEPIIEQRIVFQ